MSSTPKKKKIFLDALQRAAGNIHLSCKAVPVARSTVYKWLAEDEKFKTSVNDIQEELIDLAESMLLKNIKEGKTAEIIFYLKTKGKDRGYIETINQNVTVNPFLELMMAASSEEDGDK